MKPFGKKPPEFHRCATFAVCPRSLIPSTRIASPRMIIPMIVTTLMIANQNSNSPNTPTAIMFAANSSPNAPNAGTHCGNDGNQYCM